MIKRSLSTLLICFFLVGCSLGNSKNKDKKDAQPAASTLPDSQTIISQESHTPKELRYHDSANIPELLSGYGTFGPYDVHTKSIKNRSYPRYPNKALQTTLYAPKGLHTPRPTIFFYAGAEVYNADTYKSLFYFIASKGYNAIFLTYPNYELRNLKNATKEALEAFSSEIDQTRVGFSGHSMGAGVAFWLINQFPELGKNTHLLFPMATGYSAFNVSNMIPTNKIIALPKNTQMILQTYAKDYSTDLRIGIDLFLNNSLPMNQKDFMLVYGDNTHIADHGTMGNKNDYNALMQRTIFRPLDALMDEAFKDNTQAISTMKQEILADAYFNPYIGTSPQNEIAPSYILPIDQYPFNCKEAQSGHYISVRKAYCEALGL